MDFTKSTAIGARINQQDEQLKLGIGYDHNCRQQTGGSHRSKRYEPAAAGDAVHTTEPGLQFYSGNFDGSITEKAAGLQTARGFCLRPSTS
jgi:aldose 1-epimerase